MFRTLSMLLAGTLLIGCNQDANRPVNPDRPATPTSTPVDQDNITTDADNTGKNVRDRGAAAMTPIDQNENQADVKMTADIRSRVMDANLSINARNVKIITQDGRVTLRGPVENAGEKTRIEEIARSVAGDKVFSELEVITQR